VGNCSDRGAECTGELRRLHLVIGGSRRLTHPGIATLALCQLRRFADNSLVREVFERLVANRSEEVAPRVRARVPARVLLPKPEEDFTDQFLRQVGTSYVAPGEGTQFHVVGAEERFEGEVIIGSSNPALPMNGRRVPAQ
jgi:hypothetical protein